MGVSSLIPTLNTVTQTTTIAADGLYTLANASVGDVLKVAKNGNFWGAFKTADGASKFAQLHAIEIEFRSPKEVCKVEGKGAERKQRLTVVGGKET